MPQVSMYMSLYALVYEKMARRQGQKIERVEGS